MRVLVNGVRLFFDVEGAAIVPDGPEMHEKPTLLLLHGGPGFDHSTLQARPTSTLADLAQVVYLDHRGNGRSDAGPKEAWTLAQWGDDVRAFCEALGIERPVVLGASFGGKVAMAYATRHPPHPAKLILISTERREARTRTGVSPCSRSWEARKSAPWRGDGSTKGMATRHQWTPGCVSHFPSNAYAARSPHTPANCQQSRGSSVVHAAEWRRSHVEYDLRPLRVQCPTLLMGGEEDPMTPIECQSDIASALPQHLVRSNVFRDVATQLLPDAPDRALAIIREFIRS